MPLKCIVGGFRHQLVAWGWKGRVLLQMADRYFQLLANHDDKINVGVSHLTLTYRSCRSRCWSVQSQSHRMRCNTLDNTSAKHPLGHNPRSLE